MIQIKQYILLEYFQTNTWLLYDDDSKEGILVDPSAPSEELLNDIRELALRITCIVNTHGHGDHIGGNEWFRQRLSTKLAIHEDDAAMLPDDKKNLSSYMDSPIPAHHADVILHDGDILPMGKYQIKVIHTPGHTKGCICLLVDKFLISGDTLFEQSIGRTDFPGGSHEQIIHSIKTKLFVLDEDVVVYPGHGPRTSIGMEKKSNPFVR